MKSIDKINPMPHRREPGSARDGDPASRRPGRNRRSGVADLWYLKGKKDEAGKPVPSKLHGKGSRWRAIYVDENGREHTMRFRAKKDAQAWLDNQTAAIVTGTWVNPADSSQTFGEFYRHYSQTQMWENGTRKSMDLACRGTSFDAVKLGDLETIHLQEWVGKLQKKGLAASTIKMRMNNLGNVIRAAVRLRAMPRDVTDNLKLPRVVKEPLVIPTTDEVRALVNAAEPNFRAFIIGAAYAGLRLGEASALQVGDIGEDVIKVRRQIQRATGNNVEVRAPKYGEVRDIPVPAWVVKEFQTHIDAWTSGEPGEWLFTSEGGVPLHQNTASARWRATRAAAGVKDYRLHDLRHFFASALIFSGCAVTTVQHALGHHSPTVTLSTYSQLWPTADDQIRVAMAGMEP